MNATLELTAAARTALLNIGTNRLGTTIAPATTAAVRQELREAGAIGDLGGLTSAGARLRARLVVERDDAMDW